jgi:hypothetical protein
MRDQVDFARSLVTYDGAGESIAIPEKRHDGPALETAHAPDESLVRDFYPDGVTNSIIAESFEYAAGQVRNWEMNLPAPFNVRHFLFLKPDVFVVWDQVRSAYPLQWNLHLPAETVTQRGNTVTASNPTVSISRSTSCRTSRSISPSTAARKHPRRLAGGADLPWARNLSHTPSTSHARLSITTIPARKRFTKTSSAIPRAQRIGLIETDGQTRRCSTVSALL